MGQLALSSTIFEQASNFCDVKERMRGAPLHHRVRAHFFANLRCIVAAMKPNLVEAYDREAGETVRGFGMHPVRDYVRRLAIAGAIVAGPEHVIAGIEEVHRRTMYRFMGSSILRGVVSIAKLTPILWCESQRTDRFRHIAVNYGACSYDRLGQRSIAVHFDDEHVWPDHAMVGMCRGLLDGCGLQGRVLCQSRGPNAATVWMSW